MNRIGAILLLINLSLLRIFAQATLHADTPGTVPIGPLTFSGPIDGPLAAFTSGQGVPLVVVSAVDPNGAAANVKFILSRVTPSPPLLFVSGTSFTTPATLVVGIDENALKQTTAGSKSYTLVFSTVDQSPPSEATVDVSVKLIRSPPMINSVVNAATFQGSISAGGIVSIFGANLAPARGAVPHDSMGMFPTSLGDGTLGGDTTVLFNGIPAPLLYVAPNQINAVVPSGVAGQPTANVVVTRVFLSSVPFLVHLSDTAPGIFTTTQTGTGQGAILNVPSNPNDISSYTYNGPDNPADRGSGIEFFATGQGLWNPPVPTEAVSLIASNPFGFCIISFKSLCERLINQVSLTIGGKTAPIYYAGSAPYQSWGVMQVIATVPSDAPVGQQPVVLTVGGNDNSKQSVTMAIK